MQAHNQLSIAQIVNYSWNNNNKKQSYGQKNGGHGKKNLIEKKTSPCDPFQGFHFCLST